MTVVSKTVLKSYFQVGDRPSQSNYVDLIDTMATVSGGGDVSFEHITASAATITNVLSAGSINAASTIIANGSILTRSSAGIGYATGGGGAQTQLTDKSTSVTLNTPSGQITMNNALLASATSVSFALNNTAINTQDVVYLTITNAGGLIDVKNYNIWATNAGSNGSTNVTLRNISSGNLSEAVVFNFAVIKVATS